MVDVCDECGVAGFTHLLLRCRICNNAARHRYCLDVINFDSEVDWLCSDCIPEHNEGIKSLEAATNQRHLRNTQLGSFVVNEPNVEPAKVTLVWGLRRNRSCRKREDSVDESTKHFPGGDTSNQGPCVRPHKERRDSSDASTKLFHSGDTLDSSKTYVGDIPNHIACEKEGEDTNEHLICAPVSFDASSSLALDHAPSIELSNLQKAIGGFKLASDSTECPDLSNARTGCFASSKYVEGLVPQGRKGDMFSLMNDVEGALPLIVDKSCPTSASMEQADGLSVSMEKPEPLKSVKELEASVVASKSAPTHSEPMQGSDLKTGSVHILNPPEQHFDSLPMVLMQSTPSNELEDAAIQGSMEKSASMEQADGLSVSMEKSEPLKLVKELETSVVASKSAPNHSEPMQGSDLNTGSVDILNPLEKHLDSSSMVLMQSSPSNELEDVAIQGSMEKSASIEQEDGLSVSMERPEPLKSVTELEASIVASKSAPNHSEPMQGSDLNTGSVDILNPLEQHLDNLSMMPIQSSPSNELEHVAVQETGAERTKCLAYKETVVHKLENHKGSNSSMANESLISTEGNLDETNRRSDELLSSTKDKKMRRPMSGARKIVNSCKVDAISDPESVHGDRDAINLQCNAGNTSSLAVKKVPLQLILQEEGISNELLPSKFVGPCESIKTNPRKCKQGENHAPDGTKYQEACIINGNKNDNAAGSKSGRPAQASQNMPSKDNGSNDKVIGLFKMGKDKKTDKSWLANKGMRDSWKRRRVTSVLRSSLCRSSVDKSRPSEDMDLTLTESNCALNNPRSSCATQAADFSSKTKESCQSSQPKKQRRLVLLYEDEDAEALQTEDLNSRPCDNDDKHVKKTEDLNSRPCDNDDKHVKKRRKCMENAVNNQRSLEKGKEALGSGDVNHRCSKNRKQVKKQRSIEAKEDENASVRNLNAGCAENDVSQVALQTVVTEDHCGTSRMPLISECIDVQPLDMPYWTGIMKIDRDYIPLAAHLSTKAGKTTHLSTKAGKKLLELSRSLPPIMKVAKLSTSKSCLKHLDAPITRADSTGLYFFLGDMRPNKELDQLVKHLADSGVILEAVVGLAKLFLYPSVVLPAEYQTSQGKPYLWGVFKPRKHKIKRLAPVEQDCTADVMEEQHIQEEHVLDQQDKAQGDTLDQVVHSEDQPLLVANQVGKEEMSGHGLPPVDMKALASANISPADHRQPCSNPEAPPLKLCGFVVSRTPRSAQLIQEMQKEGALLFSVQQVMTEPGSVM